MAKLPTIKSKPQFTDDVFEGFHDAAQLLSDEYAEYFADLSFGAIQQDELMEVLKKEVRPRALNKMIQTAYGRGFLMGFLLVRNFSEGLNDDDSEA
jgi:hypothetical protein